MTIIISCQEEDFALQDETRKLFLNTRGSIPETVDKEVIHFLKYVEESTKQLVEKTESTFLRRLHERVVEIKHDRETEERYMLFEEMRAKREAEGIKQGIEQGIKRGIKQGIELGEQQAKSIMLKLITAMSADGKTEQIPRLAEDQEFFNEMLEKYQIKNS